MLLRDVDSEREEPTEQSSKADLGLRSNDGERTKATSFCGAEKEETFTEGTCLGFFFTLKGEVATGDTGENVYFISSALPVSENLSGGTAPERLCEFCLCSSFEL